MASIRSIKLGISYPRPCAWWLQLAVLAPAVARAELSDGCAALGQAMVEHSCFHSTFGPFQSVQATPGTEITPSTPNVDPVHTEYRVGTPLHGDTHVVTYEPRRTGWWSVFTGAPIPLAVVDDGGSTLDVLFTQDQDTGCEALPLARVFQLEAGHRYTLKIGPSEHDSVVVVIEYVNDFLVALGRDADGDGYGDPNDTMISNCTPPAGYAPNANDCDDADARVHPNAAELCDGVDQNCNGSPDDVGLQCRSGAGACLAIGLIECIDGQATCRVEQLEASSEQCNGRDDDCNGTIDDGDSTLCTDQDAPTCVRLGVGAFCGCLLDSDCGGLESGRRCDLSSSTCTDGCSAVAGGNGCEEGFVCLVADGGVAGECLAKPDEAVTRGTEQVRVRKIDERNTNGCSCTLTPSPTGRREWAAWLIAALAVISQPVRRRSYGTRE